MDIVTAIRIAGDKGITRAVWEKEIVIFPTDKLGRGCEFLFVNHRNNQRIPLWHPLKQDLMANDWEVFL